MKITLALGTLVVCTSWMAAQDRMTETLRKAVVEEESQHNLSGAVADYQKVVAAFDEGRKTAATALFRLAECQRQLHHDEQAKAAYERVVREFGDQANLAVQSRQVLASAYNDETPETIAAIIQSGRDRQKQEEARQEEARERYRTALLQQIDLSKVNQRRIKDMIDLGTIPPEALNDAKQQTLTLERQLAAFDMGVIPERIK